MPVFGYNRYIREIQDIVIAVLALTFAFSISTFSANGFRVSPDFAVYIVLLSLAAVCLAFLLHELAHRQVARKYGGFAEFHIWPIGLLGGLMLSFLGVVFAAPGAVYMSGIYGNDRIGKAALAGPATNMILGAIFFIVGFALLNTFWGGVFGYLSRINLLLGAFNLIPFPPLDGQKVLAWDTRNYVIVIVTAGILALLAFLVF